MCNTNVTEVPPKTPLTEAQALWVAALRSGKYKQTLGELQDCTGYCCLGVACRVAKEQGIQVKEEACGELVGSTLNAQYPVKDWLGLKSSHGCFVNPELSLHLLRGDDPTLSLTSLNDGHNYTFEMLADVIEQNAATLFNQTEDAV